jgi:hypothetical protein
MSLFAINSAKPSKLIPIRFIFYSKKGGRLQAKVKAQLAKAKRPAKLLRHQFSFPFGIFKLVVDI